MDIPIWAAVETFPFDTLSKMLALHTDTDALTELYRGLGMHTKPRVSSEVIHSMVYLRNLCSHHCRLWHREMIIRPPKIRDIAREFPKFSTAPQESVAASLNALMYLVTKIEGERKYADDLAEFISEDTKYEDGMTTPLHWR